MNAVLVALAVGLALALFLWWRHARKSPQRVARRREDRLTQKWRRLSQMPPAQADAALARTVTMLEAKHPGRRRGWYLAKAVQDLERSKR